MAEAAEQLDTEEVEGEYKRPDAKIAFSIYDDLLVDNKAAMDELKGDRSAIFARLKKESNFPRGVLDFVNKLHNMTPAKRDHWLLALAEGLAYRRLFVPSDLVSEAEGVAGASVVQIEERKAPYLAAISSEGADSTESTEMKQAKVTSSKKKT